MKASVLIRKLSKRQPGSIVWLKYSGAPSGLNAAAKRENRIKKNSRIPLQLTAYERRAAVRKAVEAGERPAPVMPDYLEFYAAVCGAYLARVKSSGKLQFRAPLMSIPTPRPEYTLDGEPVSFEEIKQFFTAGALAPKPDKAELNEKGQDPFRGVNLENIVDVE